METENGFVEEVKKRIKEKFKGDKEGPLAEAMDRVMCENAALNRQDYIKRCIDEIDKILLDAADQTLILGMDVERKDLKARLKRKMLGRAVVYHQGYFNEDVLKALEKVVLTLKVVKQEFNDLYAMMERRSQKS